ncbi:MAG: hypothetical protein M3Z09_01350 [Acidobacteriota bacterium]|nr:hypothetical protein [Acidobacteriota bacterium]
MSDRITRKDLRTDSFAVAIENNVEFVSHHRGQFIRYGVIALAVIALAVGVYFYRSYQHDVRQEKLGDAIQIQETNVTAGAKPGPLSFPTDQAKRDAAVKAFTGVANQYPGTREGSIAEYYLACIAADSGKLDEARRRFQQVVSNGNKDYASLAKLSLADTDFVENRGPEGEKLLREIMDHPTILVSKEQATIALAHYYADHNRVVEARKLLEPLTSQPNAASQAAVQILGDLKSQ